MRRTLQQNGCLTTAQKPTAMSLRGGKTRWTKASAWQWRGGAWVLHGCAACAEVSPPSDCQSKARAGNGSGFFAGHFVYYRYRFRF